MSEHDGVVVRPKVHEEQARPFIKHVAVQGRNFDSVSTQRFDHRVDLITSQHKVTGYRGLSAAGRLKAKRRRHTQRAEFAVPPRDPVTETGMMITPVGPLGVATAFGFQPTGGGKAAITGDFVLTGDEVNPVIKALRSNGIEMTALHSHMLDEQPRLFFMHFWANDDAVKLAKGLRAALDKMANAKS